MPFYSEAPLCPMNVIYEWGSNKRKNQWNSLPFGWWKWLSGRQTPLNEDAPVAVFTKTPSPLQWTSSSVCFGWSTRESALNTANSSWLPQVCFVLFVHFLLLQAESSWRLLNPGRFQPSSVDLVAGQIKRFSCAQTGILNQH